MLVPSKGQALIRMVALFWASAGAAMARKPNQESSVREVMVQSAVSSGS